MSAADRALGGEQLAHAPAGAVDLVAVEHGVRPGEVDELEDAELGVEPLHREGLPRPHPAAVDHHHFAGLELADEGGADHVEGGGLRCQHPPRLELVGGLQPTEAQRPEAVRVTDADQPVGVEEHEGEGPFERRHHRQEGLLEVLALLPPALVGQLGREGPAEQLGHQVAVGGHEARQHAGRLPQRRGVGEVAVVGQTEAGPAHTAEDRLGVYPVARAGGRVAGVPDGQVPAQAAELALVEDRGDETHVLHHGDDVAVAHRHAGRLLAAVLEGVEAVEDEVCHRAPRGIYPEDSARFLGLHHRSVTAHTGGRRSRWRHD